MYNTFVQVPNLCTSLVFDNFDRFVDIMIRKDTSHDTGIIFQNIDVYARNVVETYQNNDSFSENDVIK